MIISAAIAPKTHLANSSCRCLRRVMRVSANSMSGARFIFYGSAHDEIGSQIDNECDQEQKHAREKQDAVMVGIRRSLTQLCGDVGGQRTHRVQNAVWDM